MSVTPVFHLLQPSDTPEFKKMCFELYAEDVGDREMTDLKLGKTLTELQHHPEKGAIMIFEVGHERVGYAILIHFWSNEFGGNLTTIDELFVKPQWRSQGIGSNFLIYLEKTQTQSIGLQLEVSPKNLRAQQLYARLGFKPERNQAMVKLFTA